MAYYGSPEDTFVYILVNWLLSALALWLVAAIVPGIQVRGYGTALIATVVIAIVNIAGRMAAPTHHLAPHHPHAGPVLAGRERFSA